METKMEHFKLFTDEGRQYLFERFYDPETEENQIIGITHMVDMGARAAIVVTFENEQERDAAFDAIDNPYIPNFFRKPKPTN